MKRCVTLLVWLLFGATAHASSGDSFDWPQFGGPDRNSISRETGLLQEWPEAGPPLAWRVEALGGGYNSPSIAAGRIFGMSSHGEDEVVWALSETDGKELWVTRLGPAATGGMPQGREGPGCTPTVDGDRVYALGLGGTLACLRVEDGEIVWKCSLTEDLGGRAPTWRYNESPLVDGDRVICTPGGEESTLAALDKRTGKVIWKSNVPASEAKTERPDRRTRRGRRRSGGGKSKAGYASAIAIDVGGRRQVVQLIANTLVGVAASDGEFLWRYDRPANSHGISCSTPIYHDGLVFAASAYGTGGGAVKLSTGEGGAIAAAEVYFTSKMQNHHGGMIVFDGCLYGAHGGNGGGFLSCLDFRTGEVLWSDREAEKGSLALADGRLYLRTEKGTMLLIEPDRERYIERGRFEQPDRTRSPAWAHPVLANGKLYLRDQDLLLCYDVKAR